MPAASTLDDTATPPANEGTLLGARTSALLSSLLAITLVAALAVTAYGWWRFGFRWANTGGVSIALLASCSYVQLRLGRTRAAIATLVWGVLASVLVFMFVVAGVRTPALTLIPALCIVAGWLIDLRAAKRIFVVSSVVIIGSVVAEQFGYVPPNLERTSASLALVLVPSIFLALLVTGGAIQGYQKQLEDLRLSEERFSALFRANPMPSSTIDGEGRMLDVNDAWVALFGVAASEVTGKTAQEMGLWHNEAERDVIRAALVRDRRVDGLPITLMTTKGLRPFALYIAPVEFGGLQRLVTTLLDQTDRQAAEQSQRAVTEGLEARVAERTAELSQTVARLTAAQEELVHAEKLASLGAMVAGISHELNTPIGNTVTVSSTMHAQVQDFRKLVDAGQLRKSDLTEFLDLLEEMSDVVLRSTQRASELVTSFKQVAVDRSSERRRAFDVQTLVQELVTALKPGMRNYAVEIQVDIPPGITCDSFPGPVGQVITNLIQNALHHAFGESESGTIAIEAHQEGERVVMHVRDNGKGMDEHTLKHAFDPFFTTRLGQGGSGLGLSVSHRIATSVLGGTLSATSTPGSGSHFVFSFLRNPA